VVELVVALLVIETVVVEGEGVVDGALDVVVDEVVIWPVAEAVVEAVVDGVVPVTEVAGLMHCEIPGRPPITRSLRRGFL
jgi:hypothetical protein